MTLRVLHLVGSAVDEFTAGLSRLYAADCLASVADRDRYDMRIAYVGPDRRWSFPDDLTPSALAAAVSFPVAEALQRLVELDVDIAVPQMFCLPGMTYYRGLLDLLEIPFVGNPADVMALGADKAKSKAVVAAAGVAVPAGEVCRAGDTPTMATPAVVKPIDSDNSLGISLVRDSSEYDAALSLALQHSSEAMVESYIELGREVRCGVIETATGPRCLPLEEYDVDPLDHPIRGHDDKLRSTDGTLSLVAKEPSKAWIVDPSDPVTDAVWAAAQRCHVALGCRDYSLFDFRLDPEGQPWFLEAGLYCSFAEQSVLTAMARAAGIPLRQFFADAVDLALSR